MPTVFMVGHAELLTDLADESAPPILAVPALADPLAAAALWGTGSPITSPSARCSAGPGPPPWASSRRAAAPANWPAGSTSRPRRRASTRASCARRT
ncbi:hypothetical protein ACFQ0M_33005 [Kitasatospora aburaviensis]